MEDSGIAGKPFFGRDELTVMNCFVDPLNESFNRERRASALDTGTLSWMKCPLLIPLWNEPVYLIKIVLALSVSDFM